MNGRWPTSMVSADKLATMRATGLTGSLGLRPAAASTTLSGAQAMASSSAVCWARSLPLWMIRVGPYAGACEQASDCLDLPPARRAQRTLRIGLLRDGIAVLDEIEPHGWHSPEIHLAPRRA